MTNLYEDLGVKPDATPAEIRRAYRSHASKNHPDRKGGDAKKMAKINAAYEVLSNAEKRAHYDQTGEANKRTAPDPATVMFNTIIQACLLDPGNIVNNIEREIHNAITTGKRSIADVRKFLVKLEARAAAVEGPPGENIIADAVRAKIESVHNDIARDMETLATLAEVRKRLALYRSSEAESALMKQPKNEPLSLEEIIGKVFGQ